MHTYICTHTHTHMYMMPTPEIQTCNIFQSKNMNFHTNLDQ